MSPPRRWSSRTTSSARSTKSDARKGGAARDREADPDSVSPPDEKPKSHIVAHEVVHPSLLGISHRTERQDGAPERGVVGNLGYHQALARLAGHAHHGVGEHRTRSLVV